MLKSKKKIEKANEYISKRLTWIDVAKGICIIAIIMGHNNLSILNFKLNNFVFPFHLLVFFLLSGYTLKKELFEKKLCKQEV